MITCFKNRLAEAGWLRDVAGEADYRAVVVAAAKGAVETPPLGVLLSGTFGCGKTMAAKALYPGLKAARLADEVCLGWLSPECDDAMHRYHVLLDDFGAERTQNDYGVLREIAGDWILRRYDQWRAGRAPALSVTTNLTSEKMAARYGGRVISRLSEMTVMVAMTGGDHRRRVTI